MFTIPLTVRWTIAVSVFEPGCRRLVEHSGYLKTGATKRLNRQKPLIAIAVGGNAYQHFQRLRRACRQAATIDQVFAQTVNVFAFESSAAFAVIQSCPHEIWARFFASSMKDDLRYTPSDCFETFPFPDGLLAGGQDSS